MIVHNFNIEYKTKEKGESKKFYKHYFSKLCINGTRRNHFFNPHKSKKSIEFKNEKYKSSSKEYLSEIFKNHDILKMFKDYLETFVKDHINEIPNKVEVFVSSVRVRKARNNEDETGSKTPWSVYETKIAVRTFKKLIEQIALENKLKEQIALEK